MKLKCTSSRMPIIICLSLNNNVSKKNKRDKVYKGRPNRKNCTASQLTSRMLKKFGRESVITAKPNFSKINLPP